MLSPILFVQYPKVYYETVVKRKEPGTFFLALFISSNNSVYPFRAVIDAEKGIPTGNLVNHSWV
jgi:hypothetical protein